ncbi:stathmin isoform X14 [Rhynchophorus ferrugineus]|uniref:stathmin isoform X14 n=1 Tax=Rhynchophorus ferrugineus TaxID=354439 RepID=UPI003FCE71AE
MLIGLVKESVMQCFCHTCRAPLPAAVVHRRNLPITKVKAKPRTNQPKRVQFVIIVPQKNDSTTGNNCAVLRGSCDATEVRCQEKTRGGVRYEVILGEPEVKAAPPKKPLSPKSSMSVQDIEDKLKAAEERRQQLESSKIAALSAKMQKIEEASRKKDEQTNQFITATRDALEQKMGIVTEKREAYITDLKTKLKDHIENVEKTRLSLEQQTDEVRSAIEEKLKTASLQRDENIKKMLERLKEHNEHLNEVKQSLENRKAEQVNKIETKLSAAEQKREQEMQKKIENIKKHEKHAELVRQNKAVMAAKASSG